MFVIQETLYESLEKLLGSYVVRPLSVRDSRYGNLNDSVEDVAKILITKDGEELLGQYSNVLLSVIRRDASYKGQREKVNEGSHASIYKIRVGSGVFAVKEYRSTGREDGIRQLSKLSELSNAIGQEGIKNLRTPKLYFASSDTLFMEFIDAQTWKEFIELHPEKEKKLMDSFYKSGAMLFLTEQSSKGNADPSHESILVKPITPESDEYEFILIDQ